MSRLADNYGAPWGRDGEAMGRMRLDWAEVLDGCSETELQRACVDWLKSEATWPKAANIRKIVMDNRPPTQRPSFTAEKWAPRSPEAEARVSRTFEILDLIKKSGSKTPFTDLTNDPGYQQILSETPAYARGAPRR